MSRRVASWTSHGESVRAARLGDPRGEALAWMLYELDYVRREAQAEADLAYQAWCVLPGRDGYAVDRAAQDRADAAQDDLAAMTSGGRDDRASTPRR